MGTINSVLSSNIGRILIPQKNKYQRYLKRSYLVCKARKVSAIKFWDLTGVGVQRNIFVTYWGRKNRVFFAIMAGKKSWSQMWETFSCDIYQNLEVGMEEKDIYNRLKGFFVVFIVTCIYCFCPKIPEDGCLD